MPKFKPVIKIDKSDVDAYRILNGLSKNREFIIENMDEHKKGLLVNIGRSVQPLKPSYPVIWHSPDRFCEKRFLRLPPEIIIDEEPGKGSIFFKFKRRHIF